MAEKDIASSKMTVKQVLLYILWRIIDWWDYNTTIEIHWELVHDFNCTLSYAIFQEHVANM